MTKNFKNRVPAGISYLRLFYGMNAFLFLITNLLFLEYLDVIIFGKIMTPFAAFIIRLILISVPLYLAYALSGPTKKVCAIAIIYHMLFVINAVSIIFYLNKNLTAKPLFDISLKPEYKSGIQLSLLGPFSQVYFIQVVSATLGIFLIIYLIGYIIKQL